MSLGSEGPQIAVPHPCLFILFLFFFLLDPCPRRLLAWSPNSRLPSLCRSVLGYFPFSHDFQFPSIRVRLSSPFMYFLVLSCSISVLSYARVFHSASTVFIASAVSVFLYGSCQVLPLLPICSNFACRAFAPT